MEVLGRRYSHVTPDNRLRWMVYQQANSPAAWLAASEIRTFDSWLRRSDMGLESCPSRSAPWFAERRASWLSIDNSGAPESMSLEQTFATIGWESVAERVSIWRCTWTSNSVMDTAMWVQPGAR